MRPLLPIRSENISPEEYLNLSSSQKSNINEVSVVPPKLGEDNFGKIHVNYRIPVLKDH